MKRPGLNRKRSNKFYQEEEGDIIPWRTEEEGY
jgi:hypothetical protein